MKTTKHALFAVTVAFTGFLLANQSLLASRDSEGPAMKHDRRVATNALSTTTGELECVKATQTCIIKEGGRSLVIIPSDQAMNLYDTGTRMVSVEGKIVENAEVRPVRIYGLK